MDQDYLQALAADTIPFGRELATRVAGKLETGFSLSYSHRDYCGMGLEYRDGNFYYGALWDGAFDMQEVVVYETPDAFIKWLAAQSTATMARLEDENNSYHGNQVITRQRLEAFLQQWSGTLDEPV